VTKHIQLLLVILTLVSNHIIGQTVEERLPAELQNHFDSSNLPGFCVAMVDENRVLYQKGFGYSNRQMQQAFTTKTVENLGSTSKAILGMILLKAIKKGKLSYDSEINAYLPFKVINPYFKDDPILIRHLATHTSSILDTKHYGKSHISLGGDSDSEALHEDYKNLINAHQKLSLEDFLFKILNDEGEWYKKKNFKKAPPGKPFEYANLNAALAGLVIEKATQSSLEVFSKNNVFEPIRMNSTTWSFDVVDKTELATRYFPVGKVVPNYGLITYPDGGLYSNVEDLSLFLQELIKAFKGTSTFLPKTYAKILLPGDDENQRIFIGMGTKSRNIGHSGSDPGVQTDVQFNADTLIGRVILCNVNAKDDENLEQQYREIHTILGRYELVYTLEAN